MAALPSLNLIYIIAQKLDETVSHQNIRANHFVMMDYREFACHLRVLIAIKVAQR